MQKILTLGRSEPLAPSTRKTCWIGIDLFTPSQVGGLVKLGRECTSLKDLQEVVDRMKADLDTIVQEARDTGLV